MDDDDYCYFDDDDDYDYDDNDDDGAGNDVIKVITAHTTRWTCHLIFLFCYL